MRIYVNSKETEAGDNATLQQLIEQLGIGEKRVAIEVNTDLVIKNAWPTHVLHANDKVEIVSFVGGG